jgi:hypothetical protein
MSQMFEPVEHESAEIGSACSDRALPACRFASEAQGLCGNGRIRAQEELCRVPRCSLPPRFRPKPGFLFEPGEHLRVVSSRCPTESSSDMRVTTLVQSSARLVTLTRPEAKSAVAARGAPGATGEIGKVGCSPPSRCRRARRPPARRRPARRDPANVRLYRTRSTADATFESLRSRKRGRTARFRSYWAAAIGRLDGRRGPQFCARRLLGTDSRGAITRRVAKLSGCTGQTQLRVRPGKEPAGRGTGWARNRLGEEPAGRGTGRARAALEGSSNPTATEATTETAVNRDPSR